MKPKALLENADLAYTGEKAWSPALLTEREAAGLLTALNPCGRPNADVLRRRLAVVNHEPVVTWQVDFPDHFTPQEATLYAAPFARLQARAAAWRNPHRQPALRRALARVSRWLALPVAAETPDWRWIEDELLPDATLLVVARDDDFAQGILSSAVFAPWWASHRAQPVFAIASFPFPWPPGTLLSALSKAQEECRHDIARSTRTGNSASLNAAVLAAYGWPSELAAVELLGRLTALNQHRSELGT